MTGEKLLQAMAAADPALVEDAHSAAAESRRHTSRRVLTAALAAALVLALGAGAAAYYSDFFLDYFAGLKGGELTQSQQAAIETLTAVVGQSQTVDGWTITVDRALATRDDAYIKLDITAPEGVALDTERYGYTCDVEISGFNTADVSDEGVTDRSLQMQLFREEDMAENEGTILLQLGRTATAASKLDLADGKARTVTIKDFCAWRLHEKDQNDCEPLVDGTWRFTFVLPKAEQIELLDGTVSVLAVDPATGNREDVAVSSLRLTALGAVCEYITAYDYIQPFDGLTVTMADGSEVTGREKGNSARDFGKVCSFLFDTPIGLDAVDHVTFQGVELPMP